MPVHGVLPYDSGQPMHRSYNVYLKIKKGDKNDDLYIYDSNPGSHFLIFSFLLFFLQVIYRTNKEIKSTLDKPFLFFV